MKIHGVKIRRQHPTHLAVTKPHGNPRKAYDRAKEKRKSFSDNH